VVGKGGAVLSRRTILDRRPLLRKEERSSCARQDSNLRPPV
jgi:hypothetical protein